MFSARSVKHTKSSLIRITDDDLAWLLLRMYPVFYRDGEWVTEDALRLLKRDAMFLRISGGFEDVPNKTHVAIIATSPAF